MSKEAWMILGLVLFVVVVIATIQLSKRKGGAQKSKAQIKGPFGMGVRAESSSEITPGVRIHDATSEEGGLSAEDQTGRGVDVKKVKTKLGISVTNVATSREEDDIDPKRYPPYFHSGARGFPSRRYTRRISKPVVRSASPALLITTITGIQQAVNRLNSHLRLMPSRTIWISTR